MENLLNVTYTAMPSKPGSIPLDTYTNNSLHSFKEEILSAVREMEGRMKSSTSLIKEELYEKLNQYDKKFDDFTIKINDINTNANLDKMKLDKIDDLLVFQKKTSDQFISFEIKFNSLLKDFTNACYKYDKIYLDNLIVPGTIGDFAQFKNMREYVQYSFGHVTTLINFKEKQMADWKSYKERLDTMIKQISAQIDNHDKNLKTYTNKMIEASEGALNKELSEVNSKIVDVKIENHKHALNLQKSANDLSVEYNKILLIKADVVREMEISVNKMTDSHKSTVDSFDTVKNEFETIKNKFMDLAEFIKDVRFRKNIGVDVNRQEFKQMAGHLIKRKNSKDNLRKMNTINNNINPYEEKDSEIESYVKNYILSGNLKSFEQGKKNQKTKKEKTNVISKLRGNGREIITQEKPQENLKILQESDDEISSNDNEANETFLQEDITKDDNKEIIKKNSKELDNTISEHTMNDPNEIIFKKNTAKISKFKEKFPKRFISNTKDDSCSKSKSNSDSKLGDKNKLYDIQETKENGENCNIKENRRHTVKNTKNIKINLNDNKTDSSEILQNIKTFKENFLQFKSEFSSKFGFTEKKLLEIENFSKKKLDELENKIRNININIVNHTTSPNVIPYARNFEKVPSKIPDVDQIQVNSFGNNGNNITINPKENISSYKNNSLINNNENNNYESNLNSSNRNEAINQLTGNLASNNNQKGLTSNNIPNRLITPQRANIENDKNYIINNINPSLYPKNNPSSNYEKLSENAVTNNPYYKSSYTRSKSRKTIKASSNVKINDMVLQYGNIKNEIQMLVNKTSSRHSVVTPNIHRDPSISEINGKRTKRSEKNKTQKISSQISEFGFDSVKNVFMPFTNILYDESRMEQLDS